MNSGFSSTGDHLRANWTPPQDSFFIDLLLEQVSKGNKTGHGFRKQGWADMIVLFNTKFGFKYDTDILKNRYKRLRKQYSEMKSLVNQGNFRWDESQQMITADDSVWNDYIKAHPEMQLYRTKVVSYYNELCIICGHAVADGRYSLSCYDVDFENEAIGIDCQDPINYDPKIEWSQTMDQFFVELMLDEVCKGNKVRCSFKKKSWVSMITSFNEKFGFQRGRAVLKNRYSIFRRHYSSIKILLDQRGFKWDETEQKMVADDRIWNKYIKAHPSFRMYRNKAMPYYSDMCIICGNEARILKKATSSCNLALDKGTLAKKTDGEAMPIVDKHYAHGKPLGSSSVKNLSDQKKRHCPQIPETLQQSKKARRTDGVVAIKALEDMAVVVSSLKKKLKKEESVSIEKVIGVLKSIPDIDDDLLLDACDFLENEGRARMFLALDAALRKKWLMRKLRPQ
ncbi:unnamed protein product [Prunus brigantina]